MGDSISNHNRTAERAFGEVLRHVRKARSLTQLELAHLSGCSNKLICLLEHGHRSPSLRNILDLSSALGVPAAWFIRKVEGRLRPPTSVDQAA